MAAKVQMYRESKLSGEGRGESAHYSFTAIEVVLAEDAMMRLEQSTLKELKMGFVQEAMSEVMEPLYGCGSMGLEVRESGGRKWGCFPVIVLCC